MNNNYYEPANAAQISFPMNKYFAYYKSLLTPNKFFNATFCILSLVLLTLPFTVFMMWPFAILLLLCFFLENNWKEKLQNFKQNLGIPYGIFLFCIFLIPLTGFINSSDLSVALATFECYFWFLVAPLVLLTTSNKLLSIKHISFLIGVFVVSVTLNIIVLFIVGAIRSIISHDILYMYYSHFSFMRHPTYVSLYATFAFFLVLNYLQKKESKLPLTTSVLLYFVEILLALGVFCLYSRAGIIVFFFLLAVWGIYFLFTYPKRWKKMLVLFAVIIGVFTLLMTTDIMPVNRFAKTKYTLDEKNAGDNERSEARLTIWKCSLAGIRENLPFGVGTGDAFDVIKEKSIEQGYSNITDRHYNSHNQYLQALLTNGILGIVLLMLYFITPLFCSFKFKDNNLFTLFILLSLNCLVECIFDIRAGVNFFAIMIPLFILKAKLEHKLHFEHE